MDSYTHQITITNYRCKMPEIHFYTSRKNALNDLEFFKITRILKTEKYQLSKIGKADL